jgi:hypothetical protein
VPIPELVALTGYKFVVLCPIAIAELLVGYLGSYVVMALFGTTYAYFFWKTVGTRFSAANTLAAHIAESWDRKTFMLANTAVQGLLIWVISIN